MIMQEQAVLENRLQDFFPVKEVDYIEFFVGNAKQAAHYFCREFGFRPVAYSGLETGERTRVSYVLEQNKIRFVISGTLSDNHPIAEFVRKHGDGVKDIALRVTDVDKAYKEAVSRGAIAISEPAEFRDEYGTVRKAVIGTYGDTIHTLIERENYKGLFLPGYQAAEMDIPHQST